MTLHVLDLATALEGDLSAPVRIARTREDYWTFIGPFGGISAATALRSLAAHGSAPLAGVADAKVFHRSFGDQSVELRGAGSRLLATGSQIAYFRV